MLQSMVIARECMKFKISDRYCVVLENACCWSLLEIERCWRLSDDTDCVVLEIYSDCLMLEIP
jgi:hypothetical protein